MDFKKLETKKGASKGAFLHLRHPALGHLLYTGTGADEDGTVVDKSDVEKVGVHVLGFESERVRERAKKIQKAKLQGDEDAEAAGLNFVCSLVTEFQGLMTDGKPLAATDENKRAFFEQSDGLVEQVMNFAKDRSNFFNAD